MARVGPPGAEMGVGWPPPRSPGSGQLWAGGGAVRTGGGSPGATPDLPQTLSYAASFIAPLMITDALFAAACNVLVERCAYRSVTLESECPRIC